MDSALKEKDKVFIVSHTIFVNGEGIPKLSLYRNEKDAEHVYFDIIKRDLLTKTEDKRFILVPFNGSNEVRLYDEIREIYTEVLDCYQAEIGEIK